MEAFNQKGERGREKRMTQKSQDKWINRRGK